MTSADPGQQQRLLAVADLDTGARQLAHKRRTIPEIHELESLAANQAELVHARGEAATRVSDLQRAVTKAESDVEQVRTRVARDTQRLDSGTGTAKDLAGLQHELQSLARRQSALEDVELEAMEKLESAQADLDSLSQRVDAGERQRADATDRRDKAIAGLDAEVSALSRRRADAIDGVDADLLALYERVREAGGVAAAPLVGTRCGACRVEFSAVDLSTVKSAAPDQVVQCDDCRAILIRGA